MKESDDSFGSVDLVGEEDYNFGGVDILFELKVVHGVVSMQKDEIIFSGNNDPRINKDHINNGVDFGKVKDLMSWLSYELMLADHIVHDLSFLFQHVMLLDQEIPAKVMVSSREKAVMKPLLKSKDQMIPLLNYPLKFPVPYFYLRNYVFNLLFLPAVLMEQVFFILHLDFLIKLCYENSIFIALLLSATRADALLVHLHSLFFAQISFDHFFAFLAHTRCDRIV